MSRMRVAVIGSGIAGLAAAHRLADAAHVTLFEAGDHFGGHANTVDLSLDGITHGVDTGFLVFNERTYPGLIRLFAELGVQTAASDMSFSVQVPGALGAQALEWCGSSLNAVFCQRGNLARPRFWRMLRDILRFNKIAIDIAQSAWTDPHIAIGTFLQEQTFSAEFRDWYLLPMIGCIWSGPARDMLRFPVGPLARFCHNHGLLQLTDRPQWRTVAGGSRKYVQKIVAGVDDARLSTPVRYVLREDHRVLVVSGHGTEVFDRVVIATHPGEAHAMLPDASVEEGAVLGAIRYQRNRAVLHTDASVLPARASAWAAWNYESGAGGSAGSVCVHYLINRLQPLPWKSPVIVSLNPIRPIDPSLVSAEFDYAHPVFDQAATIAQARLTGIQGRRHTWFCGAWTGYGFHEDGFVSGERAARELLMRDCIERAEVAELQAA